MSYEILWRNKVQCDKENTFRSYFSSYDDDCSIDKNMKTFDGLIQSIFQKTNNMLQNKEKKNISINTQNIFDELLINRNSLSCDSVNQYPSNIHETIEFLYDIHSSNLLSNSINSQSANVNTGKISPTKLEIINLKNQNAKVNYNNSNIKQDAAIIEEIPDFKKNNPFKSAKEQYIKEGAKFPPKTNESNKVISNKVLGNPSSSLNSNSTSKNVPAELERFDQALLEKIEGDIIQNGAPVEFKDIAGLDFAKKCVTEMICWPMSRPDLFQGLRSLPKGLLLFGPPGTGKTLIGKAIAHQTGATFFSISSSSLTSKWIGEGEKTVRVLFAIAAYRQPSVVFIDEVDSLLSQRSSEENEASRRMKTEFLVQLDGAGTDQSARVVIIGATNRPDELDEAARRRFVKRIYIPLPDPAGRKQLLQRLLSDNLHSLTPQDVDYLANKTEGYSGADIRNLCTEAAMGPMRELALQCGNLKSIQASDVPHITMQHFKEAYDEMSPSVSQADLQRYIDWNNQFGSFRRME